MRIRTASSALAGLVFATLAAVAAHGATEADVAADAEPRATVTVPAAGDRHGRALLTESELDLVFGQPASLTESPLPGGRWCSWTTPWGLDTIIALQLVTEQGDSRFDEAKDRAESSAGGMHEADSELGPRGFTSDDGRTVTVAWVAGGRSVVLSLTGGHLTTADLLVLAKAVNTRLSA